MELRHLRYFVAVAEEGNVTLAAERRLHTSQPSLSRQIRDLEAEVGVPLFVRSMRGVDMTEAGRAFLDHARLALGQAEAARNAARRAAQPAKPTFAMGFLTGYEVDWLAESLCILRDALPTVDVSISSQTSPDLVNALRGGLLDVAFLRPIEGADELAFRTLAREPLLAVMPCDHPLAAEAEIEPRRLAGETFINVSGTAPALRAVIDRYLAALDLGLVSAHEADNLAMAMALITSRRGVALLPSYARNFFPQTVVARPLAGDVPMVELAIGYGRTNRSPVLKRFLARLDELVERVAGRQAGSRAVKAPEAPEAAPPQPASRGA